MEAGDKLKSLLRFTTITTVVDDVSLLDMLFLDVGGALNNQWPTSLPHGDGEILQFVAITSSGAHL